MAECWRDFDDIEGRGPGAPREYWWKDCGKVVSRRDPESLTQLSTPWSRDLARWTRQAEKAERIDYTRHALGRARTRLNGLSDRLAITTVGQCQHKRRKIAEMNARYVTRNGKRVYIGKKKTEAKKLRKADAAIARRARKRATSHGVIQATNDPFLYENQCILAAAEIRRRLRE